MPVGSRRMVCRSQTFHQPSAQALTGIVFEEHVIRDDDGRAPPWHEGADDMLDEGELLVRSLGGHREVGARRAPSALLRSEGWVGHDDVRPLQLLPVCRERVAAGDHALDTVEHEVHEAKAVRIRHELKPRQCVVALEESLRL